MSPLLELARFGQSYWLDDLTRTMIRKRGLQRRVAEEGLTGVTVNPAIFRAALPARAPSTMDEGFKELSGQPAEQHLRVAGRCGRARRVRYPATPLRP